MLLFHRFGELALALTLGAVPAEDVAGEDFDFRDEVRRVGGVLEHIVDEIVFVAGDGSAQVICCCWCGGAAARERDLLISDVLSPGQVMPPLDQGRLVTDVVPHRVPKTAGLTRIEARRPGLCLDGLEELMLVDCAVQLPEDVVAFVVS